MVPRTTGRSFANRFPECRAAKLTSCIRCQDCQQIFVPSGNFLILESAKNRKGLSKVNNIFMKVKRGRL
jgi:hypothetical protein